MEIEKTAYLSKYEEYKKYILERDEVKRTALQYNFEYLRVFGELVKEIFSIKINCISLKKKISYCQMKVNNNEKIQSSELEAYMEAIMQEYNEQLEDLINQVDVANSGEDITMKDVQEIKRIYRRIAKKIHPDMNPELFKDEKVQELWQRCVIAYECNNKKELEEIEVLVNEYIKDSSDSTLDIEDIDGKIEALKKEIEDIKSKEPYQYKYLLDSFTSKKEYEQQLENEKKEYEQYQTQLESILETFEIEKVLS